jgi:hypothetical protein
VHVCAGWLRPLPHRCVLGHELLVAEHVREHELRVAAHGLEVANLLCAAAVPPERGQRSHRSSTANLREGNDALVVRQKHTATQAAHAQVLGHGPHHVHVGRKPRPNAAHAHEAGRAVHAQCVDFCATNSRGVGLVNGSARDGPSQMTWISLLEAQATMSRRRCSEYTQPSGLLGEHRRTARSCAERRAKD